MSHNTMPSDQLPPLLGDYILSLIKKMGYRKKVREEVKIELTDHFTDAISDCKTDEEKGALAQTLIEQFGEPRFLAKLIRRAKKRCRPLWKKTLIRTAQATAALFLFCCFYAWWFVSGKPNIAIDYVTQLNQMVRPEASDDQNAWPHCQDAIEKYVKPEEIIEKIAYNTDLWQTYASLSSAEQKAMRDWLTQNEPAWAEFLTASKRVHLWYDYKSGSADQDDQVIFEFELPRLGTLRRISRMGLWKGRLLMDKGDIHKAINHFLAVVRTGRLLHQYAPWFREQLIGCLFSYRGHKEILHIIHTKMPSASLLINVQNQLVSTYPDGYPFLNFQGEKLIHLDAIQLYFTDGGPGGGHLLQHTNTIVGKVSHVEVIFHVGRHDTLKTFSILDDMFEKEIRLTPWQLHTATDMNSIDYLNSLPKDRYLLIHELFPSDSKGLHLAWRSRALHEATLTILALKRWFLQKSSYPDSLEELAEAGFLRTLPLDPYRDGPLTYKKQGDDFILYSYAGDFDDDDGHQTSEDSWAQKEEGGDRVFWPLETPEPSSTDL